MNAHQRRIEKRRKIRMWGEAAASYQMEMLASGRKVCELLRTGVWKFANPNSSDEIGARILQECSSGDWYRFNRHHLGDWIAEFKNQKGRL